MNPDVKTTATERSIHLQEWLKPWLNRSPIPLTPVAGDASFRRYFRVEAADSRKGTSLILMDAPPDKENSERFLQLARAWQPLGIRVPTVHQACTQLGAALLEDFGDQQLMQAVREEDPASASPFYHQALQQLAHLQVQATHCPTAASLPNYDEALLQREMDLFDDWLLGQLLKLPDHDRPDGWTAFRQSLVDSALEQPRVVVHRDYHSRNLMLLPDHQLGILDFQDAVIGPCTYDAVSLIRDCYLMWPEAIQDQWQEQARQLHCRNFETIHATDWQRWFDLMGMQRHLKAAGIFARLWLRDGKAGYLKDIPRTLQHLQHALARHSEFQPISQWLHNQLMPQLEIQLDSLLNTPA
ncbi:aminoglycoside phosphotransferase family protein [Marinospirillum alkaliphilum]|nr:phosphotransferase [Marinospirillum alkaliphilum]